MTNYLFRLPYVGELSSECETERQKMFQKQPFSMHSAYFFDLSALVMLGLSKGRLTTLLTV